MWDVLFWAALGALAAPAAIYATSRIASNAYFTEKMRHTKKVVREIT